MKVIKKIILLVLVFMVAAMLKGNSVFAEYVIQVIPTTNANPAWKSINVSDAYDACQNLNQSYSTLGTTSLKAHLTTNADWYAVSLLTYSAYGNKNASNTTGNKTGIMNFGTAYTFTSSVMEGTTTNDDRKSLYDNINTPYVESVKNSTNRASNEPGRGLLSKEFLSGSFGTVYYSTQTAYPVSVRNSLFGFYLGNNVNYGYSAGGARTDVTFRPIIWNR